MAWEEPVTLTSSLLSSLLIVLGVSLVCFLYIKFLIGNSSYKRFKKFVWGILFGLNAISCLLYLIIVYGFNLNSADSILLSIVAFFSVGLTIQVVRKQDHALD